VTAAEVLPQPKAIACVTFVDPTSRSVSVRPSDQAGGYTQRLWREAWLAQRRSREAGWPASGAPWIYADVAGAPRAVRGVPSDGGVMVFHWPTGVAGFAQLVSTVVTAIVTVDLSSGQFMSCKFLTNQPGLADAAGVGR
jgi:hypothetical protein